MKKKLLMSLFVFAFVLSMSFSLMPVKPANALTPDIMIAWFDSTAAWNGELVLVRFSDSAGNPVHVWSSTQAGLTVSDFVYTDGNAAGMTTVNSVIHTAGDDFAYLTMDAPAVGGDTADTVEVAMGAVWTVSGAALPSNTPIALVDNSGAGPMLYVYPGTGPGAVSAVGSSSVLLEFMSSVPGPGGAVVPMPVFNGPSLPIPVPITPVDIAHTNVSGSGNAVVAVNHYNFGDYSLFLTMTAPMGPEIGTDLIDCAGTISDIWGNACVALGVAVLADVIPPTLAISETTEGQTFGELVFYDAVRGAPEPVNTAAGPGNVLVSANFTYGNNNAGGNTGMASVFQYAGQSNVFFTATGNFDAADIASDDIVPSGIPATDTFGNVMAFGPTTFVDNYDPTIIGFTPASGATGISRGANTIVNFSEPMDDTTVVHASNPVLAYTSVWANTSKDATYNHGVLYTYSTVYQQSITAGQDTAGNTLADSLPFNWSFTTAAASSGGGASVYPTNTSIRIDNNDDETDSTDVTLTLAATDAHWMLISEDPNYGDTDWELFETSKTFTLSDGYGTKTVYVKYKTIDNNQSPAVSDSIELVEPTVDPVPDPDPTPDPDPSDLFPGGLNINELIKGPDTSAVYFLANDGKRHAFPNEDVYFSWFESFSSVQEVSNSTLASIALGKNVTMRPGTWLVKIQSLANVYAVEPGGIIRWIDSEGIATQLYGTGWNEMIRDVYDAFWPDYNPNGSISTPEHPDGTLIQYIGETTAHYIKDEVKHLVPDDVFTANLFRDEFVIDNVFDSISYPAGDSLTEMSVADMMFP